MSIAFKHHRLPNGLNIIGEVNDDAHTVAVGYFVKTGSRDETSPVMGVSHFLEHMMFKGTDRRTADDVNREFDEIGANYNAFTSQELTVYYAQVLPEFLDRASDLLTDMMRPALRDDDFNMEKNVILEEIGMYDDRPHWRLNDQLTEEYFGDHTLSFRVLGTNDTITALQADQMRTYFGERYSPDNMTLTLSGRFDFEAACADIEKRTQHWKPSGTKRQYARESLHDAEHTTRDSRVNRAYIAAMMPGPSVQDDNRYAAKIVSDVIGDSDGSRLYWSLIDPGIADEADLHYVPMDQTGAYVAFASCAPERMEKVEQKLLGELDGYANSIDEDEIVRAKNKIATAATTGGENPLGCMRRIGGQWSYLGEYTPLEEEVSRIMAVTSADVAELLKEKAFRPRTICRLLPE